MGGGAGGTGGEGGGVGGGCGVGWTGPPPTGVDDPSLTVPRPFEQALMRIRAAIVNQELCRSRIRTGPCLLRDRANVLALDARRQ